MAACLKSEADECPRGDDKTMIDIHYFASIRERLACERESLQADASIASVSDVVAALVARHGQTWQRVLQDERVLVAVNQEVGSLQTPVHDGDEVAFFPPVTGG